ncbi:thymidine phosphorylase family protein [Phenylobacterium soli]|uniref:Putative thymidine phosphorylase n=1 Tax=Phenylobacterium soli TaxID=2170551 RepID=A0A328AMA5_9CAUL|nr:thymidine phosphorylase family protein [Phenylobacterium soli]RAK54018.1 thymidine phosphorylase [Phenylobacterium soli]
MKPDLLNPGPSGGAAPSVRSGPAPLRAKLVAVDTFRENVVLLPRNSPAVRPERLAGLRKVEVRAGELSLLAVPNISDDPTAVGLDEVGLTQPAFRRLGVKPGDYVTIAPAQPARTLAAVRAKIIGATLSDADYVDIARDLANHRWSDMEIAAFLVACASFMTPEETLALTKGMIAAGRTLTWDHGSMVVDKHCIGGVPGNRTSLIVAPIVAAHGLIIPKTSSRAITSPSGTADTMEVFARVDLDEQEMRAVVERCNGCVVWGGRVNLSPADDVLISVERPLSIDTPEQMVASILSKKVAAGSTHLVLDIPVGPTAKVRDTRSAVRLKKLFEHIAEGVGLNVEVLITEAVEPIGRGIGPVLEARDVMAVLENREDAPADLREKAIRLAGRVLENDPALHGGAGERRARELLEGGAAKAKLEQICEAQGPSPVSNRAGDMVHEIRAKRSGHVAAIDCLRIAGIARLAGAPTDPGAGIEILRKTGSAVSSGDPLYRIYGSEPSDFAFAIEAAGEDPGVRLET